MSPRRLVLTLTTLLALTGCTLGEILTPSPYPFELTEALIVGTWKCPEQDSTFTFAADGTFTATNVGYMFAAHPERPPAELDLDNVTSASGDYRLQTPPGGSTVNQVELAFRQAGPPTTTMDPRHSHDLGAYVIYDDVWLQYESSCSYRRL